MNQAGVSRQTESACWAAALDRAIEEALDVLVEPVSGEAFVESATRPGTLYVVTATSCSCAAGAHGLPCKHRACYLAQIGELPLPETVRCISCTNGRIQEWTCGHPSGFANCDVCGGRGRVPALPAEQPQRIAA